MDNQHIVCIAPIEWEHIWMRTHQIMTRLPRSNRILYVEPPISLLSPFKNRNLWSRIKIVPRLRQERENIFVLTPPVVLPFGNIYRKVNGANQAWLKLFLRSTMHHLDFQEPILWTYLPSTADLAGYLGEKLLIYDCVDEHAEFTGFDPVTVWKSEEKLLKRADMVFVTARGLYEKRKSYNQSIHLIPNAADISLFKQTLDPTLELAAELRELHHPMIGFIGAIQDWVDIDLISWLARERPAWSFVLVGPAGHGIDLRSLRELPNIHLLGTRPQRELPHYLKGFDVCINPFKLNNLTKNVNPLKFYEYLASGKPIISTAMPEIEPFGDIVMLAKDPPEFLSALEFTLAHENTAKRTERIRRAEENSWEERVSQMIEMIDPLIKPN